MQELHTPLFESSSSVDDQIHIWLQKVAMKTVNIRQNAPDCGLKNTQVS